MNRHLLSPLLLALLLLAGLAQAAVQPLNRIVAVVNDDVVLESELQHKLELVREQLRERATQLPPEDQLRKQVLERLILDKLQLQLAERSNIKIDDEALNASLRNIARSNGMTLDEFRRVLEEDGQSYAAFREALRNQLRISRLRQQLIGNRVNVSEQEVDNLLANEAAWGDQSRQYHIAHILIASPEAASPDQLREVRQRAESVLRKLRQGADFAKLAVAYSNGQRALEGGDLGWRKPSQLPSLFADRIRDMKPGEVSDLIRSSSGFHIIKLIEVRGDDRRVITQTHVRHILLRPDAMHSEAEVRQRLEQLKERIENGDDFDTLCRSHSQDKVSAAKGGDLGWVGPGELVPRFEEAMRKLQPGEISEPIKTRYGWHLIQVLERRSHDSTADLRRARAREIIRKRKTEEELQLWLRRLRDEAYVEYRDSTG
ncbi:peptidylprolyl isomerase [Thiohalobacter sp. IOR34]|uniref:peptidylprolyl isomerase n=1 Tax=Thiohalobacter sp. IOR34 TaxID=3057176 RepID=UPI0025B14DF5|nr:peptidylprolyl isomerase [Thiohalobacter sp. IOR34]WJW75907.1 peptidylprolyl isomerase [Thiohalobacter sp. IOR34]